MTPRGPRLLPTIRRQDLTLPCIHGHGGAMYTHPCARALQSSISHLVTTTSRIAQNVESTRESTDRVNRASSIRTWIDVVAPHSSQHSRVEPTWPTRTCAQMKPMPPSPFRPISAHQGHRSAAVHSVSASPMCRICKTGVSRHKEEHGMERARTPSSPPALRKT